MGPFSICISDQGMPWPFAKWSLYEARILFFLRALNFQIGRLR